MSHFSRRDALKSGAFGLAGIFLSSCGEENKTPALNNDNSGENKSLNNEADPLAKIQSEELDLDSYKYDEILFPITVQAGSVRSNSAILHSFISSEKSVFLKVWIEKKNKAREIYPISELEIKPNNGYISHKITNLIAGQKHFYIFYTKDELGNPDKRSLLGSFRAAIKDESSEKLNFAISSCNGIRNAPWPAMMKTAEYDLDFFIHLGDMAYNDGQRTLDEFRSNWRKYLAVEGFKKVFSKTALYATWDDHEITDNFDPEKLRVTDPKLLENGLKAFFENVAMEKGENYRIWNNYRWGKTAEIFVLDCRTERKLSTRKTDKEQYISKEQMSWLLEGLKNSEAKYKIIVNSVPITYIPGAGYDSWAYYPTQREYLISEIKKYPVPGVLFVSGDHHMCFFSRIERNKKNPEKKIFEVAVTGGNTNIIGDLFKSEIDYITGQPRAVIISLDPENDEFKVIFVDPSTDTVSYERTIKLEDTGF